jgi:hypothetical protein
MQIKNILPFLWNIALNFIPLHSQIWKIIPYLQYIIKDGSVAQLD